MDEHTTYAGIFCCGPLIIVIAKMGGEWLATLKEGYRRVSSERVWRV